MGPHEIYTRARQEACKRSDVLLHRLGVDPFRGSGSGLDARGRFYCDPQDTPRIAELLYRRMPEAVEETVERARRNAARRFDLLGYQGLDFGSDIDWSLDPVHGRRAPAIAWPAIPYLDFATVGDHKIVWELNRHQFLVTLARAYRLTGDERFAAALKELWYDWSRKNPYPVGINWASTLEVAFRAISWIWTGFLLEGSAADSADFQRDLARALDRAGWYIHRFLSTYFSPNTHLLGEGVALFLIGVRYPGLRRAAAWKETGWKVILEAARKQVRPDGAYFEQSTYYHVYALDFFLHARILAACNGIGIPKELDGTIRGMLTALAQLSQTGAPPRYGDDDGGRVFDGSRNRPEHMRDPLSTGAALYQDAAVKAAAPGLCQETVWLLGSDGAAAYDAVPAVAPASGSVALPECGIYAMLSPGPPVAQLFVDGGEQGRGGAGHGHADALSVQLAAGGLLWLTDPGTCGYAGGDSSRERFRGTPAHNTLAIDGLHQADPAGPFRWGPLPRVEVTRWVTGETFDLFQGLHRGYERLPDPVVHRRWVLRLGAGLWLVRDVVEGRGTHRFDIYWHFPPEVKLTRRGPAVVACPLADARGSVLAPSSPLADARGSVQAPSSPLADACGSVLAPNRDREGADLAVGGDLLTLVGLGDESWCLTVEEDDYSPVYGVRVPAPVARWSSSGACPAEFVTAIGFGAEMAEARLTRLDGASGEAVGYEYATGEERRQFYFAGGARAWSLAGWASDAAALCLRTSPGVRELILVGGSYLEYAGKRAIDAREPQPKVECRAAGTGAWRIAGPAGIMLNPDALP